jgi:hypothetical protein
LLTPIALTDTELDIVLAAARPLAVHARVYQVVREIQRKHWDPPRLEPGPAARAFER